VFKIKPNFKETIFNDDINDDFQSSRVAILTKAFHTLNSHGIWQ
jgi:hypothetical protein